MKYEKLCNFVFNASWFVVQDQYEEIDAVYTEEKKQLNELEERFNTLEVEYNQVRHQRCTFSCFALPSFTCGLRCRSWRSDAWLENVVKLPNVTSCWPSRPPPLCRRSGDPSRFALRSRKRRRERRVKKVRSKWTRDRKRRQF